MMRVLLFGMSLACCGFSMFPVVVCAHSAEVVFNDGPMSQKDKQWYFDWGSEHGSRYMGEFSHVLVVADDGAWSAAADRYIRRAKFLTLKRCKSISSAPDTCKIVDIDRKSKWMRSQVAWKNNPSSA